MNVGSLFSGIGGMDAGLARAGLRHTFFCESDPWRREVLAARWPGVPIYDDVQRVDESAALAESVGLLAGGFPCQDLSVAGQRRGLMHEGGRSNLFFEFARIIDTLRPRWVLLENVPGLLSSNGGRDFGTVLGTLADIGYGMGWRILDSRFFGVPQRRRRVFIVGALADGDPRAASERAGEVLAVGSRCPGHPPTGTEAGKGSTLAPSDGSRSGIAGPLMAMGGKNDRGYRIGVEEASSGFIVPRVAPSLQASQAIGDPQDQVAYVVAAPLTKGSATGEGVNPPGRRQEDDVNIVAVHITQDPISGQQSPAMGKGSKNGAASLGVSDGTGVRRLTPRECERLQGLPDDWTLLDAKTPDSRRYSALGDAVTANVAEWIGRRLAVST